MAAEPRRTSAFYAPQFLVAAPNGSAVYSNDATFLDWLRSYYEFNVQVGLSSMEAVSVEERELSAKHALATVHWGAKFEKTGDELITFEITYLLENTEDGWKILGYVSHADQMEEMQRLGLTA